MKRFALALALVGALVGIVPLWAQAPSAPTAPIAPPATGPARLSTHDTVNGTLEGRGDTAKRIIVVYGRPLMRDPRTGTPRKIWGAEADKALVPNDKIWRLGADEATMLITQMPLQFGDVTIPEGACSMYLLPSETNPSQLIFNKKIGQWGIVSNTVTYADDMKATEIGRVTLKKDTLTTTVDPLTIAITPKQGGGGGTLKIAWEKTQYSVEYTIKH